MTVDRETDTVARKGFVRSVSDAPLTEWEAFVAENLPANPPVEALPEPPPEA